MTRRSIVAAISICVHAIVLLVVMTADLWRPISEWPTPRNAMAFVEDIRPVHLEDIELPARNRYQPRAPGRSNTQAAPIAAPPELAPETIELPGVVINSERDCGACGLPGNPIGPAVAAAPPPPAIAPTPQAPIRLHSGIRAPQRIVNVTPAYPALARLAHIEGVVIIEATIDEQGNVVRTQVLRSIPQLDAAAVDAVRQWKFSPTLLNGVPVPIVMTVTVNFKLD